MRSGSKGGGNIRIYEAESSSNCLLHLSLGRGQRGVAEVGEGRAWPLPCALPLNPLEKAYLDLWQGSG